MDLRQKWEEVIKELRLSLSPATFKTWFKNITVIELTDKVLTLGCPNPYTKELVERRYLNDLQQSLQKKTGLPIRLTVKIATVTQKSEPNGPLFRPQPPQPVSAPTESDNQLNSYYTFTNFIVGPTNNLAHAAALAVAETPGKAYNPLFVWGGVGIGKTHLMHAIGNSILQKKRRLKVVCVSSETFTNDLIDSFRKNRTDMFRKNYREADVLIIDDIQFISGKDSIQEEFFHTFNTLHGLSKQIIVSSDRPPNELEKLESRLRSRFEGGLIVDIQPPDFETRSAILLSKCEERNITLPPEVISFIAENVVDNVRRLEGVLTQLVTLSRFSDTPINLESASKILFRNQRGGREKTVTPKIVIEKGAALFRLSIPDIKGKSRRADVVLPRQLIMYYLRKELNMSLESIGAFLGDRDHTTIIHGIEKIDMLLSDTKSHVKQDLAELRTALLE